MYKPFAACTLPCRTIASNIPRLEIWNRIDTVYDAELGSGDITKQILESKMHWRNTLNVVVLERRTTTFHFSILDVNLRRYSLFTFVNQWRRSLHDQELLMRSVEGCLNAVSGGLALLGAFRRWKVGHQLINILFERFDTGEHAWAREIFRLPVCKWLQAIE